MTTAFPNGDEPTLDVGALPPYQRHPLVFQMVQTLVPGGSFLLVNDHDPYPLYLQLQMHFGDVVSWEYLERGPAVWRIRIARFGTAAESTSHRVRIEHDGRVVAAAAADNRAKLGPLADGALLCEVTGCPPGTALADVLDLMEGVVPPQGETSIAFERLVRRRNGSCCGGMCG